jgi:hypothetical protein
METDAGLLGDFLDPFPNPHVPPQSNITALDMHGPYTIMVSPWQRGESTWYLYLAGIVTRTTDTVLYKYFSRVLWPCQSRT